MPPKGHHKKLFVAEGEMPGGTSEALWRAVPVIAELGNAKNLGQKEIAELAGVTAPQVSKWLSRKNVPEFEPVRRLEVAWKLEPGTLTSRPGDLGKKVIPQAVLVAALGLGIDNSVIDVLAGKVIVEMDDLSEELRRAVLGAVHVLGYPIEIAVKAAREARKVNPSARLDADTWLAALRPILAKHGPPGSGTFPSSSKIKLK